MSSIIDENRDGLSSCKKLLDYLKEVKENKNSYTYEVSVGIGELKIARAPYFLTTRSLGSCVAIAVYCNEIMTGALIHIKLAGDDEYNQYVKYFPEIQIERRNDLTAYADTGVPVLIHELQKLGCKNERLTAKIIGGAKMFPVKGRCLDIGEKNVLAIKKQLKRHGIKLIAEETGGDVGRTIEFNLETGKIKIIASNMNQKII
jgi:chemotaxis protein CheD